MCYNCGCGKTDAGGTSLITGKTFEAAAREASQSVDEAKRNTLEQLKKEWVEEIARYIEITRSV